jgi:hypothetical protein
MKRPKIFLNLAILCWVFLMETCSFPHPSRGGFGFFPKIKIVQFFKNCQVNYKKYKRLKKKFRGNFPSAASENAVISPS